MPFAFPSESAFAFAGILTFLQNLGFMSGPGGTPIAWVLGHAVAFGYSAFAILNIPMVREHCCALSAAKVLSLAAAFAAAIVEEAFFRRLVMDTLSAAGISTAGQIFGSGLLFGLAHGVWGIVTGRFVPGCGAVIATGILGTALGVVYVAGERSLAPVIVSHFLITATIQPGILFAAFSGQMPRPRAGWWR